MTKRRLASFVVPLALLVSRAADAQEQYVSQSNSPQWLKDRQYNEGAGIRAGDFEIHPGIAGEVGYESNWFLRSDKQGPINGQPLVNGPPLVSVIPALEFRITPSLYLSTLGPQRREGDLAPQPPSVAFRAGVNLTYREFIGLSSDSSQPQNDIPAQRNVSGSADARLDILPSRPWQAGLFASYGRVVLPNAETGNPDLTLVHDDVSVGGELIAQPNSGTLDWHAGYQLHASIFESTSGQPFNNTTHEAFTRGRWRFRPRTALIYDATLRFLSYGNANQALAQGLVNSTPVRARIGMNGLVTERFSVLAMVGWGASFYDTSLVNVPQYDSVIGQAEIKWFLTASPGIAEASDLTLALSTIALGYTRDFQNSYLGNFYGTDRGYLQFNYFFGGHAVVTLTGGFGAVEYPRILWITPGNTAGLLRHDSFTDLRADATLFGEYRLTNSFGINATLSYGANFSDVQIPVAPPAGACTAPGAPIGCSASSGVYDMSWNNFQAFLGVRLFL